MNDTHTSTCHTCFHGTSAHSTHRESSANVSVQALVETDINAEELCPHLGIVGVGARYLHPCMDPIMEMFSVTEMVSVTEAVSLTETASIMPVTETIGVTAVTKIVHGYC